MGRPATVPGNSSPSPYPPTQQEAQTISDPPAPAQVYPPLPAQVYLSPPSPQPPQQPEQYPPANANVPTQQEAQTISNPPPPAQVYPPPPAQVHTPPPPPPPPQPPQQPEQYPPVNANVPMPPSPRKPPVTSLPQDNIVEGVPTTMPPTNVPVAYPPPSPLSQATIYGANAGMNGGNMGTNMAGANMGMNGANFGTVGSKAFFSTGAWATGLFDCLDDPSNAIVTALFPCVTFGQIAEVLDEGHSTCATSGTTYLCTFCHLSRIYRRKLRMKYGLIEAPTSDRMAHSLFEWCALCQEYRELAKRGLHPALGWQGNVNAGQQMQDTQFAMVPPMNQTMS